MEQRCNLWAVWLTWIGVPLLGVVIGVRIGWVIAAFVVTVGVVAQVLYVRWFPYASRWMGYGSVDDVPADAAAVRAVLPQRVIVYTANACPFCPIVKGRLAELQRTMGFELEDIDVTFKPELIRAKGLRSVPVVEANGRVLVGNATSERLASFLIDAAGAPMAAG